MNHNTDELKLLLPFYVAGTLDPEEHKKIEAALGTSDELRKELRFWERARAAVVAESAHAAAGHLSANLIVDYAEGMLQVGEREIVSKHLQICPDCSAEYTMVKVPPAVPEPSGPSFLEKIWELRLGFAIPVVAAVIAAIIYFQSDEELPHQEVATSKSPIEETPVSTGANLLLRLIHKPPVRSGGRQEMPVLSLEKHHTGVDVYVSIPRNAAIGIRYRVLVESRQIQSFWLPDTLQRYASGIQDSLTFNVPRNLIPPAGDTLAITIREILPGHLSELEAEEYPFLVYITRNK